MLQDIFFFILRTKRNFHLKKCLVKSEYDGNYNLWLINPDDKADAWKFRSLVDVVYENNKINIGKTPQESAKNAETKMGRALESYS